MIKHFSIAFASFCALLLTSCGYHIGSTMHPQIKSIAIADVKNDTKELLLSSVLRGKIAEQIQTDGSLKLTSPGKADCILYCRIVRISTSDGLETSVDGGMTYRPTEFTAVIEAEFTVLIPGQAEPLIPMRTVSGTSIFRYEADPAIGRQNGIRQACFQLSRKIVQYTTEAW